MTRVKICGTCTEADLDLAVEAGADALGFVVEYPDPVPWNLDRGEARRLLARVPPFVSAVLVTTGTVEDVERLVSDTRPDAVQLHGDEAPETVRELASRLDSLGVDTLKALPIDPEEDFVEQRAALRKFEACGVDGLVVDASADERRGGGTGRTVPWDRAQRLAADADVPVVLAGGLTPDNVGAAIGAVQPFAVDVISGVERERCVKSPEQVTAFVEAVTGVSGRTG